MRRGHNRAETCFHQGPGQGQRFVQIGGAVIQAGQDMGVEIYVGHGVTSREIRFIFFLLPGLPSPACQGDRVNRGAGMRKAFNPGQI
jgi:hypothetical protein